MRQKLRNASPTEQTVTCFLQIIYIYMHVYTYINITDRPIVGFELFNLAPQGFNTYMYYNAYTNEHVLAKHCIRKGLTLFDDIYIVGN